MLYEVCPGFGWGALGVESLAIRRELSRLGLENTAKPEFARLDRPITPYPVKIMGPINKVLAFEDFMDQRGYTH